jgi:hypothetical protein
MLLFELFPLFIALVSIVTGVWLFMLNLEAEAGGHAGPAAKSSSAQSGHDNTHQTSAIAID